MNKILADEVEKWEHLSTWEENQAFDVAGFFGQVRAVAEQICFPPEVEGSLHAMTRGLLAGLRERGLATVSPTDEGGFRIDFKMRRVQQQGSSRGLDMASNRM